MSKAIVCPYFLSNNTRFSYLDQRIQELSFNLLFVGLLWWLVGWVKIIWGVWIGRGVRVWVSGCACSSDLYKRNIISEGMLL